MRCTRHFGWIGIVSLLSAFAVAAVIVLPSYADIAPPPPPEGFTILPGNSTTQVRMMYEHVFMNIDLDGVAKIDANFVMRNLGNKEETMEVRFPLYSSQEYQDGELKCGTASGYWLSGSPIKDLSVWAWDQPQPVQTVSETMPWNFPNEYKNAVIPCWGVFPVIFPPGMDVPIEVKYTSPTYSYILTTGAGWNGTIGQADITFRLPYDAVQDQSLEHCFPENCTLSGRDIKWNFTDFEPTENVSISIVKPSAWWQILVETNNLKLSPMDGQVWKRLAIAYKNSLIEGHAGRGYLREDHNQQRFQKGLEAFRKAVTLVKGDFELHFQYADMICFQAIWPETYEKAYPDMVECAQQLKKSLDINPKSKASLDLLQYAAEGNIARIEVAKLDGPQPDFIILTPTQIIEPTLTSTIPPTVEQTKLLSTQTPTESITHVPSLLPTWTPGFTPTFLPSTPTPLPTQTETGLEAAWAWALFPLAAILVVIVLRRRGGR